MLTGIIEIDLFVDYDHIDERVELLIAEVLTECIVMRAAEDDWDDIIGQEIEHDRCETEIGVFELGTEFHIAKVNDTHRLFGIRCIEVKKFSSNIKLSVFEAFVLDIATVFFHTDDRYVKLIQIDLFTIIKRNGVAYLIEFIDSVAEVFVFIKWCKKLVKHLN